MQPTPPMRKATVAMYTGAALTLVAVLALVVDQSGGGLARHLHDTYPGRAPGWLSMTTASIATYLYALYGAGFVLWLWMARKAGKGTRRVRITATAAFVVGSVLLVYNFTQPHPLMVTATGALPCLSGLAAVALLWAGRSTRKSVTA
ncbi:hypothetical protein [Microtetraspora fusca]|uniref:hypothetical protein n=1 Tax=Microtetraspora fusca TaxID=1997 RepID=UPI000A7C7FE3|nr:hypothetical protein [Microtetraspora fusca]